VPRALTAEWQRVGRLTGRRRRTVARRRDLSPARGVTTGVRVLDPTHFWNSSRPATTIIEGARARAGMKPAADVLIELELS
jgi:hypothetical protein